MPPTQAEALSAQTGGSSSSGVNASVHDFGSISQDLQNIMHRIKEIPTERRNFLKVGLRFGQALTKLVGNLAQAR